MIKLAFGLAVGLSFLPACDTQQHPGSSATNGTTTGPLVAGFVSTIAGNGTKGRQDGSGGRDGMAEFFRPEAVAEDSNGNYFVADTKNNQIREIDPNGNVTTLFDTESFDAPGALALDGQDNLYVALGLNYMIIRRTPDGTQTIAAGGINSAYVNGLGGKNGPARFIAPNGIVVDPKGNIYVADVNRIRKIDTAFNVTTFAGNGTEGLVDGSGGENGVGELGQPAGLALDGAGNLYVADTGNNAIRKIDPSGNIITVAGNGTAGNLNGTGGMTGTAEFSRPSGVAVDSAGNVFVADTGNNLIRWIDPSGNVSTWAGTGVSSFGDATAPLQASFSSPYGITLTKTGGLAIADRDNDCIRYIYP